MSDYRQYGWMSPEEEAAFQLRQAMRDTGHMTTAEEHLALVDGLLDKLDMKSDRDITVDTPTERMLVAQLHTQLATAKALDRIATALEVFADDKIGWIPPGQAKDKPPKRDPGV